MIEIAEQIFISEEKLVFKFSRSSGPGGQNVNKVNTRVTVLFDVAGCEGFSDEQKRRVLKQLATRANKAGVVRVVSQRHRTQKANSEAVIERLVELLKDAIQLKPNRKKTRVTFAARQRRLEQKRRRSLLKRQRMKVDFSVKNTAQSSAV